MDAHTRDGLERLTAIVPLAARQRALPPGWRAAHRAILDGYATTGRPPVSGALAVFNDGDAATLLARLAADDLVVLGGDGEIAGAYPFTSEATPHRVTLGAVAVRAMCAVDAVAIAPLCDTVTRINSVCAVTGARVSLEMDGPTPTRVSHPQLQVGIHWSTPSGHTAHSLCRQMLFLADPQTAAAWAAEGAPERRIYSLAQAIDLGAAFFVPLMS